MNYKLRIVGRYHTRPPPSLRPECTHLVLGHGSFSLAAVQCLGIVLLLIPTFGKPFHFMLTVYSFVGLTSIISISHYLPISVSRICSFPVSQNQNVPSNHTTLRVRPLDS